MPSASTGAAKNTANPCAPDDIWLVIIAYGAGVKGLSSAKACKLCSIRHVTNWTFFAEFEQSSRAVDLNQFEGHFLCKFLILCPAEWVLPDRSTGDIGRFHYVG